jgi:hypothetical protein
VTERHKRQLDDLEDYRPFFTYWVTTVHVIGPLGLDLNQRSGLVSIQQIKKYIFPIVIIARQKPF